MKEKTQEENEERRKGDEKKNLLIISYARPKTLLKRMISLASVYRRGKQGERKQTRQGNGDKRKNFQGINITPADVEW